LTIGNDRGALRGLTLRAHSEDEESLRRCVEGDQVMGILELFVVAFLIGTPAIMLADGRTG
jgi:hypothetical protein